jgi:transposase
VRRRVGVRGLDARAAAVIRIDAVWLAVNPIDMRTGVDRLLATVVQVFGAAQAHHGYVFANARSSRIRLLVHDGFGVWCAARRLNKGSFDWPRNATPGAGPMTLTKDQFDALVVGLPWQRLEQMRSITHM